MYIVVARPGARRLTILAVVLCALALRGLEYALAAQVPATETVTVGKQGASASGTARVTNRRGRSTAGPVKPTLAVPDGRCAAEDVAITPSVGAGAEAGKPVTLTLSLQTLEAEAQAQALCMGTQDFRRAYEAFVARAEPPPGRC